jgi:prevent-host-death family protein
MNLEDIMKHVINAKELREQLAEIVKRVQSGDRYTVLYRSRPAFRIVPLNAEEGITTPLSDDPLFCAPAVGSSADGLTGRDHDLVLYGKRGS